MKKQLLAFTLAFIMMTDLLPAKKTGHVNAPTSGNQTSSA